MKRRIPGAPGRILTLGALATGAVLMSTSMLGCRTEEASPPSASARVDESSRGEITETARALMTRLEERFRATPRIFRLDVVTTRPRPKSGDDQEELRVWGFLSGEPKVTSLLLVFTAPERMYGTGLMIRDPWTPDDSDAMWYHMRTFRRFKEIPSSSLKLLVPGTCLTYEDAHGFLSTDKYDFTFIEPPVDGSEVQILARPKNAEWVSDLGYESLALHVDPERLLVTRIAYTGFNGQRVKTYELGEAIRLGELWLPVSARAEDLQSSVVSEIHQHYWPFQQPLSTTLYENLVDEVPLIERLRQALLGAGIEAETGE